MREDKMTCITYVLGTSILLVSVIRKLVDTGASICDSDGSGNDNGNGVLTNMAEALATVAAGAGASKHRLCRPNDVATVTSSPTVNSSHFRC
jgi:hypothetical protein